MAPPTLLPPTSRLHCNETQDVEGGTAEDLEARHGELPTGNSLWVGVGITDQVPWGVRCLGVAGISL